MAQLQLQSFLNKATLSFREDAFASGGEGALHQLVEPSKFRHLVAKVYHPNKRTAEREAKMKYLLQNPPLIEASKEQPNAAWVIDLLYQNGQFMGILMPKIKGKKLTQLCLAKLPRKSPKIWQRFAFGSLEALNLRMRTCFNIATVLHQIHRTQQYVLVDLKPENILMQANGLVALVDMDSVQVTENGAAIFEAPVATPEYSPPEYYQDKQPTKEETWDRFSMGVIFYQLLLGLHPFAASAKAPFDGLDGLDKKIQHGLYVHHSQKQQVFKIIPPPHQRFVHLPLSLKTLFQRCFEEGDLQPESRPNAGDWCIALAEALGLDINISNFIGPDSSLNQPSPYFKSPFDLVEFKSLLWNEPALLLAEKPTKLPIVDIPNDYSDPQLFEDAAYKINQLYDTEKERLLKRQKKEHELRSIDDQKLLDKKINAEKEANRIPFIFISSLVFIGILGRIAPISLTISIPIFFVLLWYLIQLLLTKPQDEEIEVLRQKILSLKPALEAIPVDHVTQALFACSTAELPQKMKIFSKQTKKHYDRFFDLYQNFSDQYQALSQQKTAPYTSAIQAFEASKNTYSEAIKRFKNRLKILHEEAKSLQDQECEAILEQLKPILEQEDYKAYEAEDYKDLLNKVRWGLQEKEKALKQLVVYKKYSALELHVEKERQKAFKNVDRRMHNFIQSNQQNTDELLPFKFGLAVQKIHLKKRATILGFIRKKTPKLVDTPDLLLYNNSNDLAVEMDLLMDAVFETLGRLIEDWKPSQFPGLFKHKKSCTILIRKPKPNILHNYYKPDLAIPESTLEEIEETQKLLQFNLSELYFMIERFPQSLLKKSQTIVQTNMDQIMAIMAKITEQYSIFYTHIQSLNSSSLLHEDFLKHQRGSLQSEDLDQHIEASSQASETAITELVQAWEKGRPSILEATEAFKVFQKKAIEAHQQVVQKQLNQQLTTINKNYLAALSQEQDLVIKKRIQAYQTLEKDQAPLLQLKNYYSETAKKVHETFKETHLLLQKEVTIALEKIQSKKQQLFEDYQEKKQLVDTYNNTIKELELITLQCQDSTKNYQSVRKHLITVKTMIAWVEAEKNIPDEVEKIKLNLDSLALDNEGLPNEEDGLFLK